MLFRVHHRLSYGTRLFITGSSSNLSKWTTKNALPCKWGDNDIWTVSVNPVSSMVTVLTTPARFEFKFFVADASSSSGDRTALDWEPGDNHAVVLHRGIDVNSTDVVAQVTWGSGHQEITVDRPLSPLPKPPKTAMRLVFNVHYACAPDELMYIVGSLPQLGLWNKMHSPPMTRLDNGRQHRLEIDFDLASVVASSLQQQQASYNGESHSGAHESSNTTAMTTGEESDTIDPLQFEYKYFTRRGDDQVRKWEEGPNRVVNPARMRSVLGGVFDASDGEKVLKKWYKHNDSSIDKRSEEGNNNDCRLAVLDDKWERMCMEFSIYFPGKDEAEVMHITGDVPELGAWFKPGPMPMTLGPDQLLETDVRGRKWVKRIWVSFDQKPFSYRYILINGVTKQEVWEREPNRYADFKTENGTTRTVNSMHVFKDVNFVSEMKFDAVPPDMFIGPYPQSVKDIDQMAEEGVTAVLNVQTDEDFEHRAIQWSKLLKQYEKHDIFVCRYQIRDFDRDSLKQRIHGAAHELDNMLKKGRKVYVHCTAGMGRAPAVVVAYLCWVKGMKLDDAVKHVKKYRTVAVPNVPVLELALKQPF